MSDWADLFIVSVLVIKTAIKIVAGSEMTRKYTTRKPVRASGTPGHPARELYLSWQVSWLTDKRFCPSSRGELSDIMGNR